MTFPTPYTITHIPCTSVTVDAMGSDSQVYGDPIERPIYSWATVDVQESQHGHTERDNSNISVAMPTVAVNLLDLFVINGKQYVVNGFRDPNHGFHGWQPGIIVLLNAVTG